MELKFYRCGICGQIIAVVKDTGVPVVCCGRSMRLLVPGTTDGAYEKHIPVYELKDNTVFVTVGETPHPMELGHYIEWIAVQTKYGNQRKELKPGDAPAACFALCEGDEVEAVFAFCNIHSLWKKEG